MGIGEKEPNWLADRDPVTFNHVVQIGLNHGQLRNVLSWCEEILVNQWAWQPLSSVSKFPEPENALYPFLDIYNFYFDNSKDASVFALRWKN